MEYGIQDCDGAFKYYEHRLQENFSMILRQFLAVMIVVLITGCAVKALPPVVFNPPNRMIDYQKEVKPVLDKRCVVCHSCYNSPCQLKMDSFEGLDRGASKKAVYNAYRLRTMDPTRLFTDAQTTEEWRNKDFFSVTNSSVSNNLNDSILMQLIYHKVKNPKSTGEYRPETDDLTCSENGKEVAGYLEKHPNRGMPYGFPPLKQEEFDLIAGWLVQGARGPDPATQQALISPKTADAAAIKQWEDFFNQPDAKHGMTARYIYEHLFLAHIKFGTNTNEFYELVRSKSAPGKPIELIATVRPYDDPEVEQVYYRFRKIHSTIVFKTHMVFELDDARMKRFYELFIEPEWLHKPHMVGYGHDLRSNPFVAFEQIPTRSRYQFLLDHSHYILMTFIHGPVCKGQIALNVIDDQFWVMFMDPNHDLSVRYPGFLKLHYNSLRMPIENGSDPDLFSVLTNKYRKAEIEFYKVRQDYYASHNFNGLGYDSIWKGNSPSDAPIMTIYRHFDSASVHKGVLGNVPKTMWVFDYPLFERIYYSLVAGFDVYGTAAHQLAIRLYMDGLRIEGESYFMNYMPQAQRNDIMQSWNIGMDLKNLNYYQSAMPSGVTFSTADPKREFVENVVNKHILPETRIAFDKINYKPAGMVYPPIPAKYETEADYMQAIRAVSKPGTPFFALVNDQYANLVFVRVRRDAKKDIVFTIVINRWHDNVAFLLGEEKRMNNTKDSADFIRGFVGAYPNYFFDLHMKDAPDFIDLLANFTRTKKDFDRLAKYGVNRADDKIWDTYDWFQQRFLEDEPVYGGLFDLNRYYHKAE